MKLIRLLPTRLAIAMQHSQTTRQRYSLNADADVFRDCYDFAAVCSKRNDSMLKKTMKRIQMSQWRYAECTNA